MLLEKQRRNPLKPYIEYRDQRVRSYTFFEDSPEALLRLEEELKDRNYKEELSKIDPEALDAYIKGIYYKGNLKINDSLNALVIIDGYMYRRLIKRYNLRISRKIPAIYKNREYQDNVDILIKNQIDITFLVAYYPKNKKGNVRPLIILDLGDEYGIVVLNPVSWLYDNLHCPLHKFYI